jgi:hypothetical protein
MTASAPVIVHSAEEARALLGHRDVEPDNVVDGEHAWMTSPRSPDMPFCARCMVVQRRDGKNKPCRPGPVTIGLRDTKEATE